MAAPNHKNSFDELKKSLTAFQRSLHNPEDPSKGKDYSGNTIHTFFFAQYRKATWYYHYTETLDCVKSGEEMIFRVKPNAHGLLYTDLCQRLPSIVAQEGYSARWTHNVGSNIMEVGTITFNDIPLQTRDYVRVDQYHQSMIDEAKRDILNINLGNIPSLQGWNEYLPQHDTCFTVPWFYAMDLASYFPLYYCGFLDRIEHRLKLRSDVNLLLHVRENKDGKMVPLTRDSIKSIGGEALPVGQTSKMPTPTMWGEYLYLSPMECDYNRCAGTDAKDGKIMTTRNMIHIEDTLIVDTENPSVLGSAVTLNVSNSEYPVHSFAWVAQNETSLANRYYSNYSTNAANHVEGWSPIANTTISHGRGLLFKDLPGFRTDRAHPSHHYPCTPLEPGFNFWSMGALAKDFNPKPGVIVRNGTVLVRLSDTNPWIGLKDDVHPSADRYYVKLRMDYTKRVTFTSFPLDEASRGSQHAVIDISGAS